MMNTDLSYLSRTGKEIKFMNAKEKMENVARMLKNGKLAISEAENLMEEIIQDECSGLVEDPTAWTNKYYKMKRRGWRLMLEATAHPY